MAGGGHKFSEMDQCSNPVALCILSLTSLNYVIEIYLTFIYKINRNRLDIIKGGDCRLSLTTFEPDIEKLSDEHQAQGYING